MYTLFEPIEVEMKLSKQFGNQVSVNLEDGSPIAMVKIGDDGFKKYDVDEIASMVSNHENSYGFVDYGCLMVFPTEEDMKNYSERIH